MVDSENYKNQQTGVLKSKNQGTEEESTQNQVSGNKNCKNHQTGEENSKTSVPSVRDDPADFCLLRLKSGRLPK